MKPLIEAEEWYERRSLGSVASFLRAARETMDSLSANPLIYQVRSHRKQGVGFTRTVFLWNRSLRRSRSWFITSQAQWVFGYEEFLAIEEALADADDLTELRAAKKVEHDAPNIPLEQVVEELGLSK